MKRNTLKHFYKRSTSHLAIICLACTGCSDAVEHTETPEIHESTEQRLARILMDYKEQMDCVTPVVITSPLRCGFLPSGPVVSEADQSSEHSGKLYHLYSTDLQGYKSSIDDLTNAPVGLILLKETHEAIELDGIFSPIPEHLESPDHFGMEASSNNSRVPNLVPGKIIEYFFMAKVGDEASLATDSGWLYGEMDLAGNITTLTSTGSCKECHIRSPYDRVFGIPKPQIMYMGHQYSDDEKTRREQQIFEEIDKEINLP